MSVTLKKRAIAITFAISACFSTARAQLDVPKHEIGASAGLFIYQGDLTPEAAGAFKSPGINFNLFYNHLLSRSFSLRTNLALGKLMADDANYKTPDWRRQRGFLFTARTAELSELLVWNILGNNYSNKQVLSPYIFGGVGLTSLRITRDWHRYNPDYFATDSAFFKGLAADTTHALPGTIPVIPVGVGLRYAISPNLSIMAEASYRITFTDYLDGFSESGNPNKNDYYSSYSIGLIYTLGRNNPLKCPVMRY